MLNLDNNLMNTSHYFYTFLFYRTHAATAGRRRQPGGTSCGPPLLHSAARSRIIGHFRSLLVIIGHFWSHAPTAGRRRKLGGTSYGPPPPVQQRGHVLLVLLLLIGIIGTS